MKRKSVTANCIRCGYPFDAFNNRKFALKPKNKRYGFFDIISQYRNHLEAFIDGIPEFWNYQVVICPNCKMEYKEKSLKLFRYLTPKQVIIFALLFDIVIIVAIYLLEHKYFR